MSGPGGRSRRLGRWLPGCLFAVGLAAPAAGRAEPETMVGDVVIAASPLDASLLEIALREPLDRLGIRIRWMRVEWFELSEVLTPETDPPSAAVRIWFDLVGISPPVGAEARATVYLADGPWERVLVRSVALPAGLDEVAREELATIVLTAVEGILAGEAVGTRREELREELGMAPAPAPASPPTASPPEAPPPRAPTFADRMRLELGPRYAPGGYAGRLTAVHGIALELGLVERTGFVRWGGWLGGGYTLPIHAAGTDRVDVRLDVGSLRAAGAMELAFSPTFALRFALGFGVDIVRAAPAAQAGVAAEVEPTSHAAEAVVLASVTGRVLAGDAVSLWFGHRGRPGPVDRSVRRATGRDAGRRARAVGRPVVRRAGADLRHAARGRLRWVDSRDASSCRGPPWAASPATTTTSSPSSPTRTPPTTRQWETAPGRMRPPRMSTVRRRTFRTPRPTVRRTMPAAAR
ncbi:MAG: hypothetical protein JXB32_02730 [Deltaproteobacteria bacterium]|nr:hypothetical protein [Deltaproteobacteria bacterium]